MIKWETKKLGEKRKFIHLEIILLFFRFSFYKMRDKFSFRIEMQNGWDK